MSPVSYTHLTSNLADYLQLASVAAVGGSWMVPVDAVDVGDTTTITRLCAAAAAVATALPKAA